MTKAVYTGGTSLVHMKAQDLPYWVESQKSFRISAIKNHVTNLRLKRVFQRLGIEAGDCQSTDQCLSR